MYPSPHSSSSLLSTHLGIWARQKHKTGGILSSSGPLSIFLPEKMGVCVQHSARGIFFRHSGRENVCQGRKGSGRKGEGDQRT